ncbi:NAD(P)-binding domain-containing protein, partial [Mesorhizobium sp.]
MNTTATSETIGFVGLGLMGHGIAKNIVDKGYSLTFLGRKNRKPAEDLLGRGAREASTSRDVAAASDIVFICVTGSREVEAIIRGPGGLKEGLKKGSVVVDCSTSDPVST